MNDINQQDIPSDDKIEILGIKNTDEKISCEEAKQQSGSLIKNIREKRSKEKEITEELWKETGFQRVLGGYWHNYIFNLGTMIFAMLVVGLIFPVYILPYPEAMGFKSVVSSLFSLMFTLFDVGIGSSVTRFVAEYVGRGEIKKGLEYLRFFVWFQMFTGLIQVTVIAVWALYYAANVPTFTYLIWFFLINSLVQYPGMLGIYKSALQAFQRYDKSNIVGFVQTVFLESTTQIVFILLGRWWGSNNPMMGELMGATMGYIIGLYVDDFLAMLLSGYFFANILKPYGITIWDTFVPKIELKVAKEALIFGVKNMAQGLFYQFSQLWIAGVTMIWLPNYATIIGLFTIADAVTRIVIQDLPTKAAIAESYNSKKYKLTDYYIQAQFKWYGILTFFLALEVTMLVPPAISSIAANYASAAKMVPYLMASRFFIGPIHFSDSVQQGADKPEYAAYSLFVQMAARIITFTLFLHPALFPAWFDNYNYIAAYLLADVPSILAKNVFAWWLIDRKLIKVRVNIWQTIVAPIISIIPLLPVNFLLLYIFNTFATNQMIAVILALIFVIFILFGAPILIVFPTLGLVGGWDKRGLEHLKNAGMISGPSKPIVMAMYKTAKWGYDHCPFEGLSNKFKIEWEGADAEALELVLARKAQLACEKNK